MGRTRVTVSNIDEVRAAVRRKFRSVAGSAEGFFRYPTGRAGLEFLGYDAAFFAGLPEQAVASFCGVGNPFSAGAIYAGETVLDVGSGAGLDVIYASRLVGLDGGVQGIDLTPEMVAKARGNARLLQISNADFREGSSEAIPFADETFDVVVSNGVLNLSPHKGQSFSEIHRVLKPGGRLQFADIIMGESSGSVSPCSAEAWSN